MTADLARPDDAALRGPARVHQQDIASLQQHRGRGAIGAEARHAHHRACTGEGRGHQSRLKLLRVCKQNPIFACLPIHDIVYCIIY